MYHHYTLTVTKDSKDNDMHADVYESKYFDERKEMMEDLYETMWTYEVEEPNIPKSIDFDDEDKHIDAIKKYYKKMDYPDEFFSFDESECVNLNKKYIQSKNRWEHFLSIISEGEFKNDLFLLEFKRSYKLTL